MLNRLEMAQEGLSLPKSPSFYESMKYPETFAKKKKCLRNNNLHKQY